MQEKQRQTIVIVGMPGAGKSCVGKLLAARLGLPFTDSDAEVEKAAGMSISNIFSTLGEQAFRDGERRIMARLLDGTPKVLSTGGGTIMDPTTRELVRSMAVSVWLRAGIELLCKRTAKHSHRPLLGGEDLRVKLTSIMAAREPVYATADVVIDSDNGPAEKAVDRILAAMKALDSKKEEN